MGEGKMIIDNKWVINYIKKYGYTIIIPKEATIIKQGAFDSQKIKNEFPEYTEGETKLKIEFEEGSQLETIESSAFCADIANTIVLPKNIKRIEEFAFNGYPISVQLEKDSTIEVCDNDFMFLEKKDIFVPVNLKKLELSSLIEHLDSITIPANSKLEDIEIVNGVDKITLSNGQELLSTNEKSIRILRLRKNKAMVLYLNEENDLRYEIMNVDDKTILYSRKCFYVSR